MDAQPRNKELADALKSHYSVAEIRLGFVRHDHLMSEALYKIGVARTSRHPRGSCEYVFEGLEEVTGYEPV